MKSDIENKFERIDNIWRHFIWEYDFCRRRINFSKDIQINYVGIILGYFQDTFDIVFKERSQETYVDRFAYNISLLQAIYIHQDFIEELLRIFKSRINKGSLKQDNNYSLNREIRNELIGHPIRKKDIPVNDAEIEKCKSCGNLIGKSKNRSVLLSSTLFGYDSDKSSILYLKYHIDNNYNFESKSCKIFDIIERHKLFLDTYFEKILEKSNSVLRQFEKEIDKIIKMSENNEFETILNVVSINFESIFKSDYIYDKKLLLRVYKRREEHIRYQNLIERFKDDLKNNLIDTKKHINKLLEPISVEADLVSENPIINLFINKSETSKLIDSSETKESYHYELSKLASRRNPMDFEHFSGPIRSGCSENNLIIEELSHMERNINNDLEYYSAFRLICTELDE